MTVSFGLSFSTLQRIHVLLPISRHLKDGLENKAFWSQEINFYYTLHICLIWSFFFPLCLEKCCSFTVSVVFRVSNKAHSKLPSKLASKCWNHSVFFYVFEGNSETNACTWLSKVSLKTSGLLESLDLHCLIPVCQLTVLSQNKYMCLVPNRSQEWTLYFWLLEKNFAHY